MSPVHLGIPVRPSTLTVSVEALTGATINQKLRGGLHTFGWAGPPSATAKAQANGLMIVNREDKFASCTPMKLGAPDGSHPTAGWSGSHGGTAVAYDTRVIDRTIVDIAAQGPGTELYLGLDSIPQILGGSVPPYSGTNLDGTNPATGGLTSYASFAGQVPSDNAIFADICVDIIDRIRSLDLVDLVYCGVGNEPDGGQYWTGGTATYFPHYAAVAGAVKAYDASLKVVGPELVNPLVNFTAWIRGLMVYLQGIDREDLLDGLSFHDYGDNGWILNQVCTKIDATKTELGWTAPLDKINGEWDKGPGPLPPFGEPDTKIELGDIAAAGVLQELMEMQRLGFARAIYFKNAYRADEPLDFGSGTVNDEGFWAPGNAFGVWARMGNASVVSHTLSGDPGLAAMAAVGDDDTIYVPISNMHYERNRSYPLTVALPGVATGRESTLWMIDRAHSNQYEAGLANAELQAIPVADVAVEQVRLTLPARCACLLEIAP
jgi:hypothetical protein